VHTVNLFLCTFILCTYFYVNVYISTSTHVYIGVKSICKKHIHVYVGEGGKVEEGASA